MIILSIRTDKPESELGLFSGSKKIDYLSWEAHRNLAEMIHQKIEEILNKSSISLNEVQGIVVFRGPGSFTGLRIGMSVANALAYSYKVPIVATNGPEWLESGIKDLLDSQNQEIALPEYGQPPKTTKPRK